MTKRTEITDDEAHILYDEMLDEIYDSVKIGTSEFSPSLVLKNLDPIAYRSGFNDWLDAEGWDDCKNGNYYRGSDEDEVDVTY